MKKISFYTLGCKVNTYETEAMLELFKNASYQIVDFEEQADVCVINTCTVTNTSDQKSRKIIRQAINSNPNALIVVVGCYAKMKEAELKEMDGVSIVLGVRNKDKVFESVEEYFKTNQKMYFASEDVKGFDTLTIKEYQNNTRAFLKIQDGCDSFCTYCIIPYARGRVVSKAYDLVINEAKELLKNGYQEIVLTGINTGKYGQDIGKNFDDLVEELLSLEGLYLLRISSIEINLITDKLISLMSSPKFAKHLHIPVQSASDDVLKAMNRRYDMAKFKEIINNLKALDLDINFTTDIIAGFPNETDENHQETLVNMKELGFSKLHVFPYSKRSGTNAAKLKDLNGVVKRQRAKDLNLLSEESELLYNQKYLGEIVNVLIETNDKKSVGHTTNYLKVVIEEELIKNQVYQVRLLEANQNHLIGEVVK